MCGRYTVAHSSDDILDRFEAIIAEATGTAFSSSNSGDGPPELASGANSVEGGEVAGISNATATDQKSKFSSNYNVAPTQSVPIIVRPGDDAAESEPRLMELAKWGLVPFWAKDAKKAFKPLINARSETLMESRVFKQSFMRRRCIIPADSFYEWQRSETTKIPMRILLKGHGLFAFAGIYEEGRDADGNPVKSCSIITVAANELVSPVHDRMPAILPPELEAAWLDCGRFDQDLLQSALAPYPKELMELYAVSNLVNSVRNNSPACLIPADEMSPEEEQAIKEANLAKRKSAKPAKAPKGSKSSKLDNESETTRELQPAATGEDQWQSQLKIPFN